MRSFAAISTFAVLAFSAFSSAAPLAPRTDLQSVPVIFTNLKSELTPLVAQLCKSSSLSSNHSVTNQYITCSDYPEVERHRRCRWPYRQPDQGLDLEGRYLRHRTQRPVSSYRS